jgi:E1A/CREB-binding protein
MDLISHMHLCSFVGEAENQLSLIAEGKSGKKEKGKGAAAAGSGGSKGKRYGVGTGSIDELLMSKLGEILGGNMREDFIVVHMSEVCTFCRTHVTEGCIYK